MSSEKTSNVVNDQVAIVTGASRGIGAAIALAFASQGFRVVGTATTEKGAEKITQTLAAYTGCSGEVLNIAKGQEIDALVEKVIVTQGAIHVLINNAGITHDNLAMRMKESEWDEVIATNLTGTFKMTKACMRVMVKQRYGRIVNITSVVGALGTPGQANYVASKAAVAGMTRSISKELASRGITVNCVAPGFIETEMTAQLSDERRALYLAQIPVGQFGQVEDVAKAVVFLAGLDAGYITGQELHVNGGMYA